MTRMLWLMLTDVFTATGHRQTYRSDAMNANPTFAKHVTGVMNSRQITRFGYAIVATLSIAVHATKWTNVMTAGKWYVLAAPHC